MRVDKRHTRLSVTKRILIMVCDGKLSGEFEVDEEDTTSSYRSTVPHEFLDSPSLIR